MTDFPGSKFRRSLTCAKIAEPEMSPVFDDMDRFGSEWCSNNKSKLLARTASSCKAKFAKTILRSVFEKSINANAAPRIDEKSLYNSDRSSFSRDGISIAVGITSAPRKSPTLERCVESCVSAGFNPTVFAEHGTDISGVECATVTRSTVLGCWKNWMQSLRDILLNNPDSNAIAIFQDDAIFCVNTRRFLEYDLWPDENCGAVSIYNCNKHDYEKTNKRGCFSVNSKYLLGAVAVIFPRHVAEEIAKVDEWNGRNGLKPRNDAVDTFIGLQLHRLGLDAYYYKPSLAQHIAEFSTINHGGPRGARRSATFPGENVSAFEAMNSIGYFETISSCNRTEFPT